MLVTLDIVCIDAERSFGWRSVLHGKPCPCCLIQGRHRTTKWHGHHLVAVPLSRLPPAPAPSAAMGGRGEGRRRSPVLLLLFFVFSRAAGDQGYCRRPLGTCPLPA